MGQWVGGGVSRERERGIQNLSQNLLKFMKYKQIFKFFGLCGHKTPLNWDLIIRCNALNNLLSFTSLFFKTKRPERKPREE